MDTGRIICHHPLKGVSGVAEAGFPQCEAMLQRKSVNLRSYPVIQGAILP